MDYEQTRAVLAALEREGVEAVIFGGVALNLQGLARATEDLDVFVAPTEENIRRLRAAFRFEDLEAERIDFDGLEVSVVTPETLYRMKKDTVRGRDRGDAERLRRHFGFGED